MPSKQDFWKYAAIGVAAGVFSGLTGLGGGTVMIPLFVGLLCMAQYRAHGTSLGAIIPIALVAMIPYALRGEVDWLIVLEMGAASVVGVVIGSRLMMRVPAPLLRRSFGLFLLVIATLVIVRSF